MATSNPFDGNQSTPDDSIQVPGGSESRHSQHQWIVQSFNEMKEDSKRMNERIDQVYGHLSDVKNDASLACSISRMEVTLSGIEKKLEKLDGIETTITRTKIAVGVGTVVIAACSAVTWFVFGNYLSKVIDALNVLVLK
ncbi:hypothetical protein [Enterobacter asburiae]|uniref:hypothetical protein n=1 Tax=Enterobacter asburiae TaxID=61645 RepID=UPI0015769EB7|nr:hypothetical protein [Enterobacter asburiae]NQF31018.1 hypothetical protein [Enterobacter asburiae]